MYCVDCCRATQYCGKVWQGVEGGSQQAGETSCAAGNTTASATSNVSHVNTADHAEPRGLLHALIAYPWGVFCCLSLQAQRCCSVVLYNSLHVEFGYLL